MKGISWSCDVAFYSLMFIFTFGLGYVIMVLSKSHKLSKRAAKEPIKVSGKDINIQVNRRLVKNEIESLLQNYQMNIGINLKSTEEKEETVKVHIVSVNGVSW